MPLAPAARTDITVVFARTVRAASDLAAPALAIVPDPNNWNDYGLRLFATLVILSEGETSELPISIAFEDEERTWDFLAAQHEAVGPIIPATDIGRAFITLQRKAANYAEVIQKLGFDAAIHGLRALHDVVLARLEENNEVLRLFETPQFHIGMMRNPAQYVSLRRGGKHLRRTPARPVEDAAQSFSIRANLPSSAQPVRAKLKYEPDDIFQDRCCVLIGRNGVGKTQLLKALVQAMSTSVPEEEAVEQVPSAHLSPRPEIRRLVVFSSVPTDPYPRTIEPWSGLDYEYHPLIADERPLGPAFQTAILDCMRDDGEAFGASVGRRGRAHLLEALLDKLDLWRGLHLPLKPSRLSEFTIIRRVDGVPYTPVSFGLNEYRLSLLFLAVDWTQPAVVLTDDDSRRVLSSGELAMANFIAQAVAAIETGSLLLFDEPETHLHPNFVSEFMDILQDLLDRTKSIALIATHSSHIVREVPRQRVNILQVRSTGDTGEDEDEEQEPQIVDVLRPQMQTFGSNIDDISRFVFGDGVLSHRYERVLSDWVTRVGRQLGIDEVVRRYGTKLNTETLSFIAQEIRRSDQAS